MPLKQFLLMNQLPPALTKVHCVATLRMALGMNGMEMTMLNIQSGTVYRLQGFEGNVFGSSTSLLGQ